MARTCTVCAHGERGAIDRGLVWGMPYRSIAAQWGTSTAALQRHRAGHLPVLLVKAKEAAEVADADDLLYAANALYSSAKGVIEQGQAMGDPDLVLRGIGQAVRVLSLLRALLGEINRSPQVTILASPEWARLRAGIVEALAPYPEVAIIVSDRLQQLESG